MKRIRIYSTTGCISYTVTLLIQALLSGRTEFFMSGFSGTYLLQLFAVCMLIAALMLFTDWRLEDGPGWRHMAVQLTDVFLVVFGVGGGCFRWFPWSVEQVAVMAVFLLVVYALTYGAALLQHQIISMEINEKLSARNKRTGGRL